ncbi:MAG: STAS domain-containing protein [Ignavibacteria bacterium]|nr:STAS domain-containing protein [Ignavibacteria bacterium]
MDVTIEKHNSYNNIILKGRLDTITSIPFEKQILALIENGEINFLIDCEQLNYISSAGLRVLLLASKKVTPNGGKVVLSALQDHIREVFEISGFTAIFKIFGSHDEAVTFLN